VKYAFIDSKLRIRDKAFRIYIHKNLHRVGFLRDLAFNWQFSP